MKDTKITLKGIVRRDGKYLIVKKWYDDRITDPYQWGFIDGYAQIGDSPDEAIEGYINEQTYLDIAEKKILYTWSYQVGDTGYVGLAYLCEADADIVILSEELTEYKWVEKEEFADYIENKYLLNDVLKALDK